MFRRDPEMLPVSGECGDFTCSVARARFGRSLQVFSILFSKEDTAGVTEVRDVYQPARNIDE
jgi:hypothetical protein